MFHSLDTDHSGEIGFDELFEFVRGRRHALDRRTNKVKALSLVRHPEYELDELVWDADELRHQIHIMCGHCKISTADLLRAWDRSGDRTLNQREFMHSIGELFRSGGHEKLWKEEVQPIAADVFKSIAGRDAEIGMSELEMWLRKVGRRALSQSESSMSPSQVRRNARDTKGGRRSPSPPPEHVPMLKNSSAMAQILQERAAAEAKAARESVAAKRREQRAKARAREKERLAIDSASSAHEARVEAARAAEHEAREAVAERHAFVRTPPASALMAMTIDRMPLGTASTSGAESSASTSRGAALRGLRGVGAGGFGVGAGLAHSAASLGSIGSIRSERRRNGLPVQQRWEVDSSRLPPKLKPGALRFCAPLPRTRMEGWQAERPSLTTLPPWGQLRPHSAIQLLAAARQEAERHERWLGEQTSRRSWRSREEAALARDLLRDLEEEQEEQAALGAKEQDGGTAEVPVGHEGGGEASEVTPTETAMRRLEERLTEEVSDRHGVDLVRVAEQEARNVGAGAEVDWTAAAAGDELAAEDAAAAEMRALESRLSHLHESHQMAAMLEAVDAGATGEDAADFLSLYQAAFDAEMQARSPQRRQGAPHAKPRGAGLATIPRRKAAGLRRSASQPLPPGGRYEGRPPSMAAARQPRWSTNGEQDVLHSPKAVGGVEGGGIRPTQHFLCAF